MSEPYRAAVVGCHMGGAHARVMAALDAYELVAVCDLNQETARATSERTGNPAVYLDYATMLAEQHPDVVAVATPSCLHVEHCLQAVEAGARGICCEKPMAVDMRGANAIVDACRERGVGLIVNHQRRLQPDLVEARRLIESGAIGEVQLLRGQCAGDLLSDGTHLVDSLRALVGDPEAEWAFGQCHREFAPDQVPYGHNPVGTRFGHRVEAGLIGVVQLKSGHRIELLVGDLRERGRVYQDYEVFGTHGRLWRCGDALEPNLFIADGRDGTHAAAHAEGKYHPQPSEGGGAWRPVEGARAHGGMEDSYSRFASMLADGGGHPLSSDNARHDHEILMALLESARLGRRVQLPVEQLNNPLDMQ